MALPLSYHWRSLFVRRTTTVLTILVVAAVVGVFAWLLGFARALEASLAFADDRFKLIVLKRGATAESNSAIPIDEAKKLDQLDEVERDPSTGTPLISPEMITQVSLPRVRDNGATNANVAVRGVTSLAFKVHRNVRLLGPCFSEAQPEAVVGEAASRQFAGLKVGQSVKLGYGENREYKVVGYFSADGGPMESEIWTYLPSLQDAYRRSMYSSVSLRVRPGADVEKVIGRIEGPAIQLSAQSEADYWHEQARNIRVYLTIACVLVVIMCLAAVFSIANTMFSAVAGRAREIAMLRTVGFSGFHVLTGFLIEALMLSALGGVIGCVLCGAWLAAMGNTKDMFGATSFTTMAFEIRLTPLSVGAALLLVCVVGMLGALVPAARAARARLVTILREP